MHGSRSGLQIAGGLVGAIVIDFSCIDFGGCYYMASFDSLIEPIGYANEKNDVGLEIVNGAFDLQACAEILGINGDQTDTPGATASSKAAALINRASRGS